MKKCSICHGPIKLEGTWAHGHNAEPVAEGRCCLECNAVHVVPIRMKRMHHAKAALRSFTEKGGE